MCGNCILMHHLPCTSHSGRPGPHKQIPSTQPLVTQPARLESHCSSQTGDSLPSPGQLIHKISQAGHPHPEVGASLLVCAQYSSLTQTLKPHDPWSLGPPQQRVACVLKFILVHKHYNLRHTEALSQVCQCLKTGPNDLICTAPKGAGIAKYTPHYVCVLLNFSHLSAPQLPAPTISEQQPGLMLQDVYYILA